MVNYRFDDALAAGVPLNEINAEAAKRIGYRYNDAIAAGVSDEDINVELRKRYQKQKKETSTFGEDLQAGGARMMGTLGQGALLIPKAVAALDGSEEMNQKIQELSQSVKDYWREKDPTKNKEQGAGKITSAIAQLPAYLNPVGLSAMVAGGVTEAGENTIDQGGSLGTAQAVQAINAASQGLGIAVPVGLAATPLKNALAGGAAGAATTVASHLATNVAKEAGGLKPDSLDKWDVAASAVPGMGIGFFTAKGKGKKPETKPIDETVSGKDLLEKAKARDQILINKLEAEANELAELSTTSNLSDVAANRLNEIENQLAVLTKKHSSEIPIPEQVVPKVEPTGKDVDVSQAKNPFFTKGIKPNEVDVEADSITGETSFGTKMTTEPLPDNAIGYHEFDTGKSTVSIPRITESWFNGIKDKMHPVMQAAIKTAKDYEKFLEIHEIVHGLLGRVEGLDTRGLEALTNQKALEFFKAFKENPELVTQELQKLQATNEARGKQQPETLNVEIQQELGESQQHPPVKEEVLVVDQSVPPVIDDAPPIGMTHEEWRTSKGLPEENIRPQNVTYSTKQINWIVRELQSRVTELSKGLEETYKMEQEPSESQLNILDLAQKELDKYKAIQNKFNKQSGKVNFGFAEKVVDGVKDIKTAITNKDSTPKKTTNYQKIHSADEAIVAMKNAPDLPPVTSVVFRNIFGRAGLSKIYESNPVIRYVDQVIWDAKQLKTRIANDLWYGKQSALTRGNVGPFMHLRRQMEADSPSAILAKVKDSDLLPVMKILEDAFDHGIDYTEAFNNVKGKLNAEQTQLWKTLTNLFEGLSNGITNTRKGWFPAVRKGNFMVKLYSPDNFTIHAETFRSAPEAQHFIDRWNKIKNQDGVTASTIFDLGEINKNKQTDLSLTFKLTDIIANEIAPMQKDAIKKTVDTILGNPDPYAPHQIRRAGIPGYEGSRLFQTEAEQAKAWKEAIHTAVEEHSSRAMRGKINRDLIPLLDSPTDIPTNTLETGRLMRDVALNRISGWTEGGDRLIRDGADKLAVKIAKSMGQDNWFPKNNTFDKASGISTRLFHIAALTTRAVFVLGQAISSPLSIREMLRDTSLMRSLASTGKGTLNILYGGNNEFRKAVNWVANNTESFHPNFINDLNSLGEHNLEKWNEKVFQTFTGETMSTAADSFSRYWTFSMMYENLKSKGLRGTELYREAARKTDSTMIMYSRAEKAPIFQKMGIVGQAISPLMTFAQGNLANFIADLRLAKQEGNIKPAAFTILMTTALGGVIGAPFIAEWEALRNILIAIDPDLQDDLPSIQELATRYDSTLAYGLVSTVTGFDAGSSLRWNPLLSGMLQGHADFKSIFPALAFGIDSAKNMFIIAAGALGADVSNAQNRNAHMALMPGGYKGILDDIKYEATTRKMVPDRKKGDAVTPQTDKERAATYLGTRTMETVKEADAIRFDKQFQERLKRVQEKHVNLYLDNIDNGNENGAKQQIKALIKADIEPDKIINSIIEGIKRRNIPLIQRYSGLTDGNISTSDAKKYLRLAEYELERLANGPTTTSK